MADRRCLQKQGRGKSASGSMRHQKPTLACEDVSMCLQGWGTPRWESVVQSHKPPPPPPEGIELWPGETCEERRCLLASVFFFSSSEKMDVHAYCYACEGESSVKGMDGLFLFCR